MVTAAPPTTNQLPTRTTPPPTAPSPSPSTTASAAPPSRPSPNGVVSVGFNDHDTILALGTIPVGVREWYGEFPAATWEWATDELGDAEPTVLSSAELDFEAVAALDPDMIVGIFSDMTEEDYGLLSQIAPTVASPEEFPDYGTPWRETTRIYGQVLGATDRAEELITDIDDRLAQIRAENPEFAEAEGVAAFYAGDQFGLDRDVVVWVTATEEEIQQLQEIEALESLGLRADGREVVTDFLTNGALLLLEPPLDPVPARPPGAPAAGRRRWRPLHPGGHPRGLSPEA